MNNFLNEDWTKALHKCCSSPLFIYFCIALFFAFKMTHLFVPYYWDELGVYSRAALYMFDHEVTLLPGIIPPELSRGHPLLCTAIFGTMYKILGPHIWVGHLTSLIFSCGLLTLLYMAGRKATTHGTAALACILLMIQPVFVAQSTMVLPEVILAFFCTAGFFAYINRQLTLLAICSSLAIFTKETAIALPAAIGFFELARCYSAKRVTKENILTILSASTPILLLGIFLLVQKARHGWYFFPLHTDYVSFSFQQIFSRLCYYLSFLFKGQGRYVWTMVIVFASISYLVQKKANIGTIFQDIITEQLNRKGFLLSAFVFIVFGLIVSMLNFHLARYTLFILPALCLIVANFLFNTTHLKRYLTFVTIFMIAVPFQYYSSDEFNFDADMGYLHAVKTQVEVSRYIEQKYAPSTAIMSNFPINFGLLDHRAGYVKKDYDNVVGDCNQTQVDETDVLIFSYPGNMEFCRPDKQKLVLQTKYVSSFSKVFVYTPL